MQTQVQATQEWTPKMESILRAMWSQGASATKIAQVLQPHRRGLSRNAVVGKVHRLGLQRVQPKRLKGQKPQKRYQAHQVAAHYLSIENRLKGVRAKKQSKLPPPKKDDRNRVGPILDEIGSRQCRWPVGIETGADQMFCGCDIKVRAGDEGVLPYCEEHLARAKSTATPEHRERAREMGKRQALKNYRNGVGPFKVKQGAA